jgi:hypothetical protein
LFLPVLSIIVNNLTLKKHLFYSSHIIFIDSQSSDFGSNCFSLFPDFLKGFCPAGAECKKKHFYEKSPEKSKPDDGTTGEVVMREKKVPPAKPKRKSICQTPLMTEKKARVRYYDEKEPEESEKDKPEKEEEDARVNNQPEPTLENSPSYEQKRKRLLRKVELAKQVSQIVTFTGLDCEIENHYSTIKYYNNNAVSSFHKVNEIWSLLLSIFLGLDWNGCCRC